MKKIVLALSAVLLVAAGCNSTVSVDNNSQSQAPANTNQDQSKTSAGSSGSARVTPDAVIDQINASLTTEQKASQTDDSDLFKSDATLNNFSEVENAN